MHEERLRKSCQYFGWHYIACAVLDVFEENVRREAQTGIKASADTWAWQTDLRREIYCRVKLKWCALVGLDGTWFPYSEDGLARLYFRFRKRSPEEIEEFRREVRRAPGDGPIS